MKLLTLSVLAVAALTAPAMAACQNYPIVTPDTASNPVITGWTNPVKLGGTAYTKTAFCPTAAAPGTCTGESLSEQAPGAIYTDLMNGNVPDILRHRNGLQIGPVFIPLTGYLPGAC